MCLESGCMANRELEQWPPSDCMHSKMQHQDGIDGGSHLVMGRNEACAEACEIAHSCTGHLVSSGLTLAQQMLRLMCDCVCVCPVQHNDATLICPSQDLHGVRETEQRNAARLLHELEPDAARPADDQPDRRCATVHHRRHDHSDCALRTTNCKYGFARLLRAA